MRFPATMRTRSTRIWIIALLAGAGLAVAAPGALAAESLGVGTFVAANCSAGHEECGSEPVTIGPFKYSVAKEPTPTQEKEQGYTQAAGHPAYGITDFEVATIEGTKLPNEVPAGVAEGKVVTHVRTDVGPGVSTNPEAVKQCSMKEFDGEAGEVVPGSGFYFEPECSGETEIGVNKVTVYAGPEGVAPGVSDLPLEGKVYNLAQPTGLAADFGVALELPEELTKASLEKGFKEAEEKGAKPGVDHFPTLLEQKSLEAQQYYSHTLIEGSVEWAGNYHDYYEINISPKLPLIASRLILKGNIGNTERGGFITNPSNCAGPGPATTNTVTLTSTFGEKPSKPYTTPIGTEGCEGEALFTAPPFKPTFTVTPETTQSDQPDGVTTELQVPHAAGPKEIDSSQLKTATVTLPEGMTLNPAAAYGLEACKPSQIGIGTRNPVRCPAGAKIGTVTLEVPDLPPGALQGNIYLGGPESGPITGPPYVMYLDAESARYGVSVRLKGTVVPNGTTGQLTATFENNPEQPFSNAILHFDGGPLAPLANPLTCGTATTEATLVPYIGAFATAKTENAFTVDSNGSHGACSSPLPFALTQATANQPATAGGSTSFAFALTRPPGQQYLGQIRTVLPAGLVGRIPAVTLCNEQQVAEAKAGTGGCPASSRIGSVTVLAGAGPAPYQFSGAAYLTGPYNGAPYGLAIVVPAVAGPFSLGNVVTQETISVEPYTARVVVAGPVPTIYKGIPLRMQSLTVEVNRQGFMLNPTTCATLQTESTLTGMAVLGSSTFTTQSVSTPFSTEACNTLAFKPSLTASTSAKTSKANGASLEVKMSQGAGQANIQKVITTLPKQLVSRLTTLHGACLAATFEVNPPGACPATAMVGTATATTPVLPGTMTGQAYFVSHGSEAFPDLDVILRGSGVTVILVGHTNITNGITTTTFEALPDVPVSSFALSLPMGPNSALAANGGFCRSSLVMPTTIVGQNGVTIAQKTKISVSNCPVLVVKHRTSGVTALITVKTPSAGSLSGSGTDLKFTKRSIGKAEQTTIKVPLTGIGRQVLGKFRQLRIKVRVGFTPKKGAGSASKAFATVTFRA
jgi:hypothetical protein